MQHELDGKKCDLLQWLYNNLFLALLYYRIHVPKSKSKPTKERRRRCESKVCTYPCWLKDTFAAEQNWILDSKVLHSSSLNFQQNKILAAHLVSNSKTARCWASRHCIGEHVRNRPALWIFRLIPLPIPDVEGDELQEKWISIRYLTWNPRMFIACFVQIHQSMRWIHSRKDLMITKKTLLLSWNWQWLSENHGKPILCLRTMDEMLKQTRQWQQPAIGRQRSPSSPVWAYPGHGNLVIWFDPGVQYSPRNQEEIKWLV